MSRIVLSCIIMILLMSTNIIGQILPDKLPISYRYPSLDIPTSTISITPLEQDYINSILEENSHKHNIVGVFQATDVRFPEDGTIVVSDEGTKVWRVRIHLPHANGIGLYFDEYRLPQGVEMFLYNENRKHLKSTYSHLENNPDKSFATDAVQGEYAYLELNIHPSINIDEIELHIHKVASYLSVFRELEHIEDNDIEELNPLDDKSIDLGASVCMINANCPEGDDFEIPQRATVNLLISVEDLYLYTCSGVMINNTGNIGTTTCKYYVLTASRCETNNIVGGTLYSSDYIVRFNHNPVSCADMTTATPSKTLTGMRLLARSDLPYTYVEDPELIKGDFLLMEILKPIPLAWNVHMAGYKKDMPEISVTAPDKIMSFHQPYGDIKKLTVYSALTDYSLGDASTHWQGIAEEGYTSDLGAPLFDKNGRVIGIASIFENGYLTDEECLVDLDGHTVMASKEMRYSKMMYCWTNPGEDGSDFRMLKPWLDPADTDEDEIISMNTICLESTLSNEPIKIFDADISVFPNPSHDGIIEIQFIVPTTGDYKIEIVDISGRILFSKQLEKLSNKTLKFNLSHLSNGIYFLRFSNEYGSKFEKIMINK